MASIEIKNTNDNILIARKIRDANKDSSEGFTLKFTEDNSMIIMEGEKLTIPDKALLTSEMKVNGMIRPLPIGFEILDEEKGKTVNLHLDAELVKEINIIRSYVKSKTQHDVLLELFKKGLEQYKKENDTK
ncbi:hypothetical protein [Aneurinibacillus aneurinilyticus]|uniref:Uncharacterized protein n=1 Tax=Aneurinibacillus aneurinilyticus TaxID=1391 RepID=A0A848CU54_ANEAE|nr:hypothetical protein [Aneurinibacillus aneurinilyticus]NME97072.1 hypothetical protein [Aneurinibacillus aneurinilyticus]